MVALMVMKEVAPLKKVAFLFGAGAESEFGLSMGSDFLMKTLFVVDKEIKEAVEKHLEELKFNRKSKYKYSAYWRDMTRNNLDQVYKNSIYKRCIADESFYKSNQEFVNGILSSYERGDIYMHHGISKNSPAEKENDTDKYKKEYEKKLNEFKILIDLVGSTNKCNIDGINSHFFEVDKDGKIRLINVEAGNQLDQYFHTIINPDKYGKNNFSKIVNYYWAVYLCIMEPLLSSLSKCAKEFSDTNYDAKLILNNIPKLTDAIWNLSNEQLKKICTESYYNIIDEKRDESFELVGILTTNYTPLSKICGIGEEKIAYMNGRLDQFEIPGKLDVIKFDKETNTPEFIYFPFVFGQSYSKPIVHPLQMKEYQKASKILEEADVIVVLGYGINSDDNHVNAHLHHFAEVKRKKLVIVEEESDENIKKYSNQLCVSKSQLELVGWRGKETRKVLEDIIEKLNTF